MDQKDFERLISGERFKNQAGSMTAEPLGRESYRSESALSGTVSMTPEEKAMDIRTNQNPAVFEELEREYRNAKDPKVKAILGEEIQRQLSQKSGLPTIGGLGLQGSGGAGLVGPAFPRDSRALPDFAGEKSRRDAQAASDESPISTSLGRGWERTKQMAGDTFNLLTGDAEGIRQNALDWQKYDEANPQPTSAKEFSEGHQAAGDSVGAMLKNAISNPRGLALSGVEQATNSIPSMVGSIAGAAKGASVGFGAGGPLGALAGSIIGGIIGATPGSFMIEPGAKVAEAMAESSVDLANPDAVKTWFSANYGELIEKGLLKAGGVAVSDGLMGGIGQAIIARPALAFAAAQNRALAKIGVNAGDKAAVAAARQLPEYRALMAQPARDFLEATTIAKNAMRGTASFAAETFGEGAGEYWGEYLAEGEGNFNEAMLESLTAGITSVATTGAQYGASKVLFGPDQTVEEIKALAAIQSQEQKPAAPQPNSPLSNAAEAAKPVDPFAEMLAPITERLSDREIYGKIRGNEALGPDALGDILASYRVATNKNADPMQRQEAIDRLGEFFRAFDNMPNFTQGTPESSGQSSGLPVVAPTQGSGVGFVDPAAGSIDGEARTVADPLSLGDQPRLPAPPRRLPSPPPALIADSREAQRIVAEYESAYQDLVKADQLGASDQELMQRQINLRNAEARLSELNQFIESRRLQESAIKRDALLSDVLATLPPGQNPLRAFDRALKQNGFTDTNFTEAEKAKIARFMDIAAAQDEQQAIPSAPNEAGDFGIPEKVVSRTPATNAVANMLNAGWQWDGGWNLVSPTGERYNLKAAERQFLKAQAAKTRVRKPIVSPSQQEQANDAALDEGSNQGQRADDAGGQGIARPGGIVHGGLLRGAAAPAQRGGADSTLGDANANGIGALNGLPATQQVAEKAPQANDAQAGAEQGAAPEAEGVADSSLNRDSSWVIRNKETGEVVMETFDKAKVDALNTAKYEAVPVQEYLGSINGKSNAQPTSLPNQGATQAQPPAQAPVVPAAVASQGASPITSGRSLADRTDAQLTHLVTNGSTQEVRTAAKAEIDRRASTVVPAVVTGGQESAPATEERAPAKPLSQWTAEEIQARLDRGNLSPESEQKLRDLLATKPKPKATKPEAQISIGNAPGDAQPVTVRNGVIYIGEEPAIDYDTEQDVTIQEGATPQQIVDALKESGVIGRRKVFGLRDQWTDPVAADAAQPRQRPSRMTALDDDRIKGYASDLAAMAPEAGWAEEGGKLIRDANGKASRTAWIPRAEWFRAGMINSPSEVEAAVQKAIAGQPMSTKEKRTVQGMMDYLDAMNEVGDGINEELGAIEREGVYDFSEQVRDDVEFGAEIDFENLPAQDEAAALRAMGFTEEEANEVTQGKQGDAAGVRAATDEVSEADAGKSLEDGAGGVAGSQQGREAPEGFDLTGQTNEQAAKQFAQQHDDEDVEPTKAQADRERDAVPFSLTGQSQPKPQGVQAGLFTADGRPSVDATQANAQETKSIEFEFNGSQWRIDVHPSLWVKGEMSWTAFKQRPGQGFVKVDGDDVPVRVAKRAGNFFDSVTKSDGGLFAEANNADSDAKPVATANRGEVGASLTKAERQAVLKTLVDVYKQNRAPKEFKGLDSNGNERYGYAHSPEYFMRSDITGAMVRYYVTLPDGRIAHPTELFADYTQSDIDAEIQRQISDEKASEEGKAWRNQQIDSIANQSLQKVRAFRGEQFRKVGKAIPDRLVEFYSEDEGKWFAVEDQEVAKVYRNELRERGYREVATYRNDAGPNQPAAWMPKSYVEDSAVAAEAKREEPDSWMKEIFGDGANAAPAAAQPKRSIDMAGLVKSLRDFSQQKLAEANDWASRQYKQNNTQINLDGDGPTRNESMSVSAANESRRRRNVESLQQQAQFASNLANRIENGRNVQAEVEQAIRNADNDIARDGKPRFGGTRESQIEAYISNSMLGDANYGYGDGTVASVIRKAYDQGIADGSAKREEFTHNGVRIYPARVNVGGVAKDMWGIESFENKAKREAGERHGFGDALVDTEEQAKEAADRLIRDDQSKAEYEAGVREKEADAARKKAAIEADTFNGFLDDKAPNVKALIRERLAKQWRFDGDKVMTARERIESLWKAGELSVSTYEEDKIKPMSRAQFNRATQREQDAHEKKVREGGKVTVYQVNGSDLGKTAYDYAQHLLNQEVAAKREELQARIEAGDREKYAGPADVSSRAGQMELANRAGTISVLKAMNNKLRQIAPDEAWADANIEDAADLDALRDQISQALVDAQRSGQTEANPLRKALEEMSGQELKAVFDEIGLAGELMSYEERIDALLAEDAAEVRAAIAAVTGESEVRNDMQARIQAAEQQTNHDATPAQKEAGNYAKGKFAWNGLTVSVETAKGEDRTDKETNGDKWRVTMPATYGYILGTVGADKDHVDVFMGDIPDSDLVFVVNQNKVDSQSFDEHKVMAGFASAKDARDAYLGSFEGEFGKRVFGSISGPYSVKAFREMLDAGAFGKAKPIGEAISPLSFVDVEVSGEQKPANVAVQEIDDQLSLAKQLLECVLS